MLGSGIQTRGALGGRSATSREERSRSGISFFFVRADYEFEDTDMKFKK